MGASHFGGTYQVLQNSSTLYHAKQNFLIVSNNPLIRVVKISVGNVPKSFREKDHFGIIQRFCR